MDKGQRPWKDEGDSDPQFPPVVFGNGACTISPSSYISFSPEYIIYVFRYYVNYDIEKYIK